MDRLAQLLDVLTQELGGIEGVRYCGLVPRRRDEIALPAILLTLAELIPDPDPGTGELALVAHWEARILISEQMPEPALWALVQVVMHWLTDYPWPQPSIGRPQLKQAGPDHFTPDYQGHRLWLVEWAQSVRIGENVWDGQAVIPSILSIGWPETSRTEVELPLG